MLTMIDQSALSTEVNNIIVEMCLLNKSKILVDSSSLLVYSTYIQKNYFYKMYIKLTYLSGHSLSCWITSPKVVSELFILQPSLNRSIDDCCWILRSEPAKSTKFITDCW